MPRQRRALNFAKMAGETGLPRVGDLFRVRLGIRTGANPVFLLSQEELNQYATTARQLAMFRPVADIIRDGKILENQYVFYPYGEDGSSLFVDDIQLRAELYEFYTFRLLPCERLLRNRRSLRDPERWWELSEPRLSWQPRRRAKIVTQAFGKRGNFAFDAGGLYAVVQGNAWFWKRDRRVSPDLYHAYSALLNSPVFEAILGLYCPRKQRPQYELYWKYVKNIIIPDLAGADFPSSIVDALTAMGRAASVGNHPDPEELDRNVALAYGIPLSRIRGDLVPGYQEEIDQRFAPLAEKWKKETWHLSNIESIIEHESYKEIIQMGEPAIRAMLDDFNHGPYDWFPALVMITGENPVAPPIAGFVTEMAKAWIEWGKRKRYI